MTGEQDYTILMTGYDWENFLVNIGYLMAVAEEDDNNMFTRDKIKRAREIINKNVKHIKGTELYYSIQESISKEVVQNISN